MGTPPKPGSPSRSKLKFGRVYYNSSWLLKFVCSKFVSQLIKNGNRSFAFLVLIESLNKLKLLTRFSSVSLLLTAILSLRPLLLIDSLKKGKKLISKYSIVSNTIQVTKAIQYFLKLVNRIDHKYDLPTRVSGVALSLVFKKNAALRKLRQILRWAVVHRYKVEPQVLFSILGNEGKSSQKKSKRPKKMKGYYFSNYHGLYQKLSYAK